MNGFDVRFGVRVTSVCVFLGYGERCESAQLLLAFRTIENRTSEQLSLIRDFLDLARSRSLSSGRAFSRVPRLRAVALESNDIGRSYITCSVFVSNCAPTL